MRNIIYYLFFCFVSTAICQNNLDEVVGSYYMQSGSPEGGTTIIILPNKTFVVVYFGGMRKGTWEAMEEHYKFTYHVEPKFVLYARNKAIFKDLVSIRFAVDGDKTIALRVNGTKNTPFTRVFNKDANCFQYPYIKEQTEPLKNVDICTPMTRYNMDNELRHPIELYSFNVEEDYNEFIIIDLPREYTTARSFSATFINGTLVIDGSKEIEKRENYIEINEEDAAYIKRFTENELLPKTLEYGNEFFPNYDNPTETDLLPFTRIESEVSAVKNIKILEKSLFTVRCED